MSGRLGTAFAAARGDGRAALICYVTAGDPSLDELPEIVRLLEQAGADAVEVGVPFSDPVADGPVIQASSMRALERGVTPSAVLDAIARTRQHSGVPIILMTYHNPVFRMGYDAFARAACDVGVDATIQTDLPPDEAQEWVSVSRHYGIDTIFLVAPTSTDARIRRAARLSTGFLYCVARMGVTGADTGLSEDTLQLLRRARTACQVPMCVGFGISTPGHAAVVAPHADGVIVGSAVVRILGEPTSWESRATALASLVRSLREAVAR